MSIKALIEAVEPRTLLTATLDVNTFTDPATLTAGLLSLRQALAQVQAAPGNYTINVPAGNYPLAGGTLNVKDPGVGNSVAIKSVGGTALIDAQNHSTVLDIDTGTTAQLTGLQITGGNSPSAGGIGNNGDLTLTDSTVSGNTSTAIGGGILNNGILNAVGSTLSGNSGTTYAGGLYNHGAATLTDCLITGNSAAQEGGIANGGTLTLTGCTISNNKATYGAGVGNAGTLTISASTINGNSGTGAVGITNVGKATVINCTIAGNSADLYAGAILNGGPAVLSIIDSTISGNSALLDGGIYSSGAVTLNGTIVAGNSGGDLHGTFTGSYNLVGDGSGGLLPANHNLAGNPLLGPLGDYGGPTRTIPLLPGSRAIDAGSVFNDANGDPIASDQRGVDRPQGIWPDIGAFESRGFKLTAAAGSTPQVAQPGTSFANALAVTVTANDPGAPVDGGVITFTAPGGGASFSGSTAIIQSSVASVTATAGLTPGAYTAVASASPWSSASFSLSVAGPAPTLASTTIDNGTKQRSLVRSLTFKFSSAVTLSAGAITLAQLNTGGSGANDGSAPTDASAALGTPSSSDGGLTWVVPIKTTSAYSALGSLTDGVYTTTVHASLVVDTYGQHLTGGDQMKTFHRLFGDINGDKRVNATDYQQFTAAFGSNNLAANYVVYFDYNHDNRINATDYQQFSGRFGKAFVYTG
ncbi:MAG: hypothetical protein JWO87_2648 [Phycisphaerales bacterium]|nr:hypothetical protein [Phycisphaerales bacterium]